MSPSRRNFLTLAAAGVASLTVTSPAHATPRLAQIKIRTAAGTFDAVAAGPTYGPKVMLLHGFPELGLEWEAQLCALAAAGFRAVAPDQRGYSPGVRPADIEDYWLDYAVDDVVAMADSLGWRRFDLVGHDWGAGVAWVAAARYARRIRSLTAVSVPHLAAFAEALRSDPEQIDKSKYMDNFRRPAPLPENDLLRSGKMTLAGVPQYKSDKYYARLSQPGALTAALNWYRANDFQGYEQRVTVPTLFIASTKDPAVALSGVRATKNWVTGPYRVETLEGVGHFIPEEQPGTTTALLLNHLATL